MAPEEAAIAVTEVDGDVRRIGGRVGGMPRTGFLGFPCECRLGFGDGRVLFVSQEEEPGEDSRVGSIGLDGSGPEFTPLHRPVGAAAWSPAGWPLVFVPNSRTFRSPGGGLVGPNPDLWRLDGPGATPTKILAGRGIEESPEISTDGERIVFIVGVQHGSSLLDVVGLDGSGLRTLTRSLLGPGEPAWSPDGGSIAVDAISRRDRRTHIYAVPAGGGRPRRIVSEEVVPGRPAWSPDGRWIAYATPAGEVREVHPDGTGARTIAERPGKEISGLVFSPDGSRIAYRARPYPDSD